MDALMREGRAVEAGPLAAHLGQGSKALEATLRARLREYAAQPGWKYTNIASLPNGTFHVALYHMKLGDLSVLQGLPVSELDLDDPDLKDLRLVSGLPLTSLSIGSCQVTDLSPLRGLKLERLDCSGCGISDLEPIQMMPLRKLSLEGTQVTDLHLLEGLPLEDLYLKDLNIKSLDPLRTLPLRSLSLAFTRGDVDMAAFHVHGPRRDCLFHGTRHTSQACAPCRNWPGCALMMNPPR